MKRILTIFGTRPEAIKLAPVVRQLKKQPNEFNTIVGVTGQHDHLLQQVLDVFNMVPTFNLRALCKNQSLSQLTSKILVGMDPVIENLKPNMIIVQGDTTTAFAAALAAYYHQVPIAHVEAGLATRDKYQPFPEEINRTLIDQISDLFFAPTENNRMNLLKSGIPDRKIHVTGNTVIEALATISALNHVPQNMGIPPIKNRMILITAHRRESFGKPFEDICRAIQQLSNMHPDIQFIYPLHPNPRVRRPADDMLSSAKNIDLIESVDYLSFVYLMKRADFILTDSGGIQEEAPSLNKPVLILRNKTERQELVDAGGAQLVGTDPKRIIRETNRLIEDNAHYQNMAHIKNPFGDETASSKIIETLREYL